MTVMMTGATRRGGKTSPRTPFAYKALYRATPLDRIEMVKIGVSAVDAKRLIGSLAYDQAFWFEALNLKTATVNRKASANQALSPEDGERVIGLAKLIGQVEAMVEDSGGDTKFDVASWLAAWLREPLPALGGVRPIHLLDTMEGQALVAQMLTQVESGAYA
ncbi:antitoxin Xre/MbcA/ParS toxin-binding domain-containing protein [Rhizorhabdus sp. FW153]|uniref:antitoxin Xre/MbcA/ParS toxin-binding domain-containing protein n=1 Tax=Rhizorhabdus sp. FW153 TaxID=3400216 RepID=UPI003CFA1BE5